MYVRRDKTYHQSVETPLHTFGTLIFVGICLDTILEVTKLIRVLYSRRQEVFTCRTSLDH